MGAFYCEICRQTDFSGKGHIYGKSHQSKLKVVLVKFLEKVKEARRCIKRPQVEKYDAVEHEKKFWCYCCGLEVQKHVTDGRVTVLHGALLEHMSTREHRNKTHAFWWKNKADPKLKEKFLITEEEAERLKAEVTKALEQYEEKEDTLLKEQAAIIRSQEHHRLEVLQSLTEVCFPGMKQHLIQSCRSPLNTISRIQHSQPVQTWQGAFMLHHMGTISRQDPAMWTLSWKISDMASLSLAIRTLLEVGTFTQALCLHGCWRNLRTRKPAAPKRRLVLLCRSSLNIKSKRSLKNSHPIVWGPTLTIAPTLMLTGCLLLDECGTVEGAGSQDTSSDKRRLKVDKRERGVMEGRRQRSKNTSVMGSYEQQVFRNVCKCIVRMWWFLCAFSFFPAKQMDATSSRSFTRFKTDTDY